MKTEYVEPESAFLEVFGETPLLKVLDFLVIHENFDYSMSDIARLSEVGYATLKLFWPRLEQYKIVMQTRKVGKAKMYRLNYQNPVAKKFRELYWEVTKTVVHDELKDEKIKVSPVI